MTRSRPSALIGLSIGLLVATILGIQLGQSAIADINPIHFQGPATRPVGIDPNAAQPAPDGFAQAYGWDQGQAALAVDCGANCDSRRVREAMTMALAEPSAPDAPAPYWRDVTPTTELRPWRPGALPNRGLSVERYMHYPVTEEEAAAGPREAPAQALAVAPAAATAPTATAVEPADE